MRGAFNHFCKVARRILLNRRVLLNSIRDDRGGRMEITEDAVNIGARLKALAGVTGIPVSKKTFRAIERFFRTEALPPINI